jgi:hypothetical protein
VIEVHRTLDTLELEWLDEQNKARTLELYTTCEEQYEQWRVALEVFVPSVFTTRTPSPHSSLDNDERGILSGAASLSSRSSFADTLLSSIRR